MSGGGGTTTQNTIQNKDPWAPAQPYLTGIMSEAQRLYNSGAGSGVYGGPTVSGFTDPTKSAMNFIQSTANQNVGRFNPTLSTAIGMSSNGGLTPAYNQPMSTYGDVATGAALPTAASQYLTPMASSDGSTNPWLSKVLDENASRIGNRVASQMSGAGRYGSFGHAQALTDAINASNLPLLSNAYESDQNRKITAANSIDSAARAADATRLAAAGGQVGALNFGQQNQANWANMLPTINNLQYDPGNRLLGIGGMQQQQGQSELDAARQFYQQQQAVPWTQLNNYLGGISGLGGLLQGTGTSTSSGTSTTQQQTPWTQYAGLGIAGLGLLSDRNEKTDIKKVADHPSGLPLYSYRYKDDPKTYPKVVGPMAQDIEELLPGSTFKVGGKLAVKPEALGILGL